MEREGAGDLGAGEIKVQGITAAEAREVGAALELRDPRELPSVDEAAYNLILAMVPQLNRVGRVEDVRAIRRLHAVIVIEVKLIQRAVDNPHRLAPGVVHVD